MTANTGYADRGDRAEDMDVRKPRVRVGRAGKGRTRRSLVATTELLAGLSGASAEAFGSMSAALTPDAVASGGLRACVYAGLRDGNARFFEELSRTSRKVFDALRGPDVDEARDDDADVIDYDRLAQMVAAEMRRDANPQKEAS